MEDSSKKNYREIIPIVVSTIAVVEVIVSAIILISTFWGRVPLGSQLLFHIIVAAIWIAIGFVVYQMDWFGFAYVFIAILLLLVTTFLLLTVYTMTDYILSTPQMEEAFRIINYLTI